LGGGGGGGVWEEGLRWGGVRVGGVGASLIRRTIVRRRTQRAEPVQSRGSWEEKSTKSKGGVTRVWTRKAQTGGR